MASSGRGSLRPYQPSKTNSFLVVGLLLVVLVLGYNYWNVSISKSQLSSDVSKHRTTLSQSRIDLRACHDKVQAIEREKIALEKEKVALRQNERELEDARREIADMKSKVNSLTTEVQTLQDQLNACQKNLTNAREQSRQQHESLADVCDKKVAEALKNCSDQRMLEQRQTSEFQRHIQQLTQKLDAQQQIIGSQRRYPQENWQQPNWEHQRSLTYLDRKSSMTQGQQQPADQGRQVSGAQQQQPADQGRQVLGAQQQQPADQGRQVLGAQQQQPADQGRQMIGVQQQGQGQQPQQPTELGRQMSGVQQQRQNPAADAERRRVLPGQQAGPVSINSGQQQLQYVTERIGTQQNNIQGQNVFPDNKQSVLRVPGSQGESFPKSEKEQADKLSGRQPEPSVDQHGMRRQERDLRSSSVVGSTASRRAGLANTSTVVAPNEGSYSADDQRTELGNVTDRRRSLDDTSVMHRRPGRDGVLGASGNESSSNVVREVGSQRQNRSGTDLEDKRKPVGEPADRTNSSENVLSNSTMQEKQLPSEGTVRKSGLFSALVDMLSSPFSAKKNSSDNDVERKGQKINQTNAESMKSEQVTLKYASRDEANEKKLTTIGPGGKRDMELPLGNHSAHSAEQSKPIREGPEGVQSTSSTVMPPSKTEVNMSSEHAGVSRNMSLDQSGAPTGKLGAENGINGRPSDGHGSERAQSSDKLGSEMSQGQRQPTVMVDKRNRTLIAEAGSQSGEPQPGVGHVASEGEIQRGLEKRALQRDRQSRAGGGGSRQQN